MTLRHDRNRTRLLRGIGLLFLILSMLFLRWIALLRETPFPDRSEWAWVIGLWCAMGSGCVALLVLARSGTLDRRMPLVNSLVLLACSLAAALTVFLSF